MSAGATAGFGIGLIRCIAVDAEDNLDRVVPGRGIRVCGGIIE